MVVINTSINLLFKIPISILPIINVYAQFSYKNENSLLKKPSFKEFYLCLIDSRSFSMIEDLYDMLYCFTIMIRLFIYIRFDITFKTGFHVLFKKSTTKVN